MVHIREEENKDNHHFLDNYSTESIRIITDMMTDLYSSEWQRTHDIEYKASNTIGFVGVIFSLTIVTLSSILVNLDEVMRSNIFFSSILSPIAIFLILLFMILSIFFGIMALSIKNWAFPFADQFLDICKNSSLSDNELLDVIFENHKNNVVENSRLNDKISVYLRKSHTLFILSLISVALYFMYVLNIYL